MKELRLGFLALLLCVAVSQATPYDYGWRADLSGLNERPTPNNSPATGTWYGHLDGNCDTLSYNATWGGLVGSYTASHIHAGTAAIAGPVRHGLEAAGPTGTLGGVWGPTDGTPMAPVWVAALYNDSLYVNVHSTVFGGGEIRGQIRCEPDTADFLWGEFGRSQCIQLCEDYDSYIRIWGVPSGLLPIVRKEFGCVTCEVNCYPTNIYIEFLGGVWQPEEGYVYLRLRGNGCGCITFEGFLAVEMGQFDAVAGDGQVTLNWNTQSENNNDRFEIERDGQIVGTVDGLGNSATGHNYSWVDRNVTNGRSYSYQLFAVDVDGSRAQAGTESVTPSGSTIAESYTLLQNYPNPFNPETNIAFELADAGVVNLKVYDMTGRLVATLVNGAAMPRGSHIVSFDAGNLPSGIYVYRMETNGFADQKKMLLLK